MIYHDPWMRDHYHRIERLLPTFLPEKINRLHQAMHYALCNGGKRLRPLLVYAAGLSFQADIEVLDRIAAAIECVHTYSLIHDDLPAMDDDNYRRGRLTCHKAFDEATAILAGDALHTLAFELLSAPPTLPNPLTLIQLLAKAIGALGMIGGQSLDMQADQYNTPLEQLMEIHALKTGCLFHAAIQMGALAANVDEKTRALLTDFAHHLGLAFQIRDDLIDPTVGGQDLTQQKATYPALLGVEASTARLNDHLFQAKQCIKSITPCPFFDPILQCLRLASHH